MSWDEYPRYISAAERKAIASKKAKALHKQGYTLEPVDNVSARGKIATSFWGHAWCRHLETFSDYENRLPRGRSYVRNGSVLHLGIAPGEVSAMVHGSELYELTIRIETLDPDKWAAVKASCQGKIGSLIELLQGRISDEIMHVVTHRERGLFPSPGEIHFNCNCPDWADMCKHVASVMYGIGARLDAAPELLFKLRGVDHGELIAVDTSADVLTGGTRSRRRRTLAAESIADVFGIDDADEPSPPVGAEPDEAKPVPPGRRRTSGRRIAKKKAARKQGATKKSSPQRTTGRPSGRFQPTGTDVHGLRKRLKLSRAAFARETGVTPTTVRNWEAKAGVLKLQTASLRKLEKLHQTAHRSQR